ncbi:MAG: Glycogen synthase [Methanomethylovorans sp. PtaU1.Bin093]|jgi:starch phosphorylase|uniref:alpha-glucan family phosphorylase n=1 Tax=Methanomethylovorans sp. PtaU1.Bin093 TaxID=1811679 RepID=UPI0009C42BC2|nr:alpha-glucan family phosphorylase [Methanomethylovorans sp. PtaU1.Bin093]OPY19537.1 MAG: Glycogen synthase [Methanomethylovorans sp. PtaU1.Bin093]
MQQLSNDQRSIAYFSMEIGIDEKIHTYSGGLGILAGDTIRSSADLKVPLVAVTLLYRKGYFRQKIEADGWQREEPAAWDVEGILEEMPQRTIVMLEGRTVHLRVWKYEVKGVSGFTVPIYFLDTDMPENHEWDRTLTHHLYGGDEHYRLCQEVILGIGGIRMLRALGHQNIGSFHMNEGHAALLTLELLDEHAKKDGRGYLIEDDRKAVRRRCVFTTHTLVPAGHDKFPIDMARRVLGQREDFFALEGVIHNDDSLNMTRLALNLSRYVNGVARKHGEATRLIFTGYSINSITNGVHAATWVSEPFQKLFDKYIPIWKQDNFSLRYALSIPKQEIWVAHMQAKNKLLDHVNKQTGVLMDENILTIGFARRAATYKRADLLFQDIERLKRISSQVGKIQVIYAGKAHPRDYEAKKLIQRIFQAKQTLNGDIKLVYLEDYNMTIGAMITAGVDIWLNTPEPPMEASGTSGMKAALNGVPNLSVLDGWWIEGNIEGVTGWSIGEAVIGNGENRNHALDATSLYDKLEQVIVPLFYNNREQFISMMSHSIAINGSFFNTHRMMQEYVLNAYFLC